MLKKTNVQIIGDMYFTVDDYKKQNQKLPGQIITLQEAKLSPEFIYVDNRYGIRKKRKNG